MRFNNENIFWLLCSCVLLSFEVLGQRQSVSSNCPISDSSKPAVYITISPTQENSRLASEFILQLHNNTTCRILVEVGSDQKKANGATTILYDIGGNRWANVPKPGNYQVCESCLDQLHLIEYIQSGEIRKFGIKHKHAKAKKTVSIEYLYEWQLNLPSNKQKKSRVYFDHKEWPAMSK